MYRPAICFTCAASASLLALCNRAIASSRALNMRSRSSCRRAISDLLAILTPDLETANFTIYPRPTKMRIRLIIYKEYTSGDSVDNLIMNLAS